MARPNKNGLDYFPLDVDFFNDEKILAISGEFAVKGEIITLRLLCEIYNNGYFVEYSELLKNKLARLGGLNSGLIDEVVGKLVKYGFFDESLFCEENILTSIAIQKRYSEAIKRRKFIDISHYWLLNEVNVNNNYASTNINVNINSQSKVKESKVKEIETPKPPEMGTSPEKKNNRNVVKNYLEGINEAIEILKKSKYWRDLIISKNISEKQCLNYLDLFMEQIIKSKEHDDILYQDFLNKKIQTHFNFWLDKQIQQNGGFSSNTNRKIQEDFSQKQYGNDTL